jgi:hypothetical protein
MHNLQALGDRKSKMSHHDSSSSPDTIAMCPCCHQAKETQQHMITCINNPQRATALIKLSTGVSTYKENHKFVDVTTDCLEQWLLDPESQPCISAAVSPTTVLNTQPIPLHMLQMIQTALTKQSAIGWMNIFRGFFSTKWLEIASSHMISPEAAPQNSEGHRRLGTILQRIQGYIKLVWAGRNDALHRTDSETVDKYRSLEAAKIRHYFNQPHLLAIQDQHYCQGQVINILRQRPSHRRRWLMRVRRARADLLKDKLRQAQITKFFPRAPLPIKPATPTNETPKIPLLDNRRVGFHYHPNHLTTVQKQQTNQNPPFLPR